jgi:putative phosphoribosyl transferase
VREQLSIPAGAVTLPGDLDLPDTASAIVVFAHGSGSSRLSERNRRVAETLRGAGTMGTLLFDLLTPAEDATYSNRFNIPLLAERLEAAMQHVLGLSGFSGIPLGLFGASTGAAAAIVAAVDLPHPVRAVVSRGGRPDLAGDALDSLAVPTLLIVGGDDTEVIALNRGALARIPAAEKELKLVEGATHLFEEPGTLAMAAQMARGWFDRYLVG